MTLPDAGAESPGWVRLPWDSNHFGFSIGRLLPRSLAETDLAAKVAVANQAGIRCLYWLADQTPNNIAAAQLTGFKLAGLRMVLERPLPAGTRPKPNRPDVRTAVDADMEALRTLAASSHRNTRFYSDSHFPRERADAMYAAWISRSDEDPNQRLLVTGPIGAPVGYLACELDESNASGGIGLIAVDERLQGKGLGGALLDEALRWLTDQGANRVSVVTQAKSSAAVGLYRTKGFAPQDVAMWFHIWFGVEKIT